MEGGITMEQYFKIMIKGYIDMLGERDMDFLKRIYSILKGHLTKNGRL